MISNEQVQSFKDKYNLFKMTTTTLTCSVEQLQVINKALDLYSRLCQGQLGEIEYLVRTGEIKPRNAYVVDHDDFREVCEKANRLLGFDGGSYHGITSEHLPVNALRAYELHKVIAKALAEHRNPKPDMRSVDYDGLWRRFTDDTEPVVSIVSDVAEQISGEVFVEHNFYSVDMLRANPDKIYVFGDNAQRYGKKGQSIIRDEPNAFGVATKIKPHGSSDSYFSDDNEDHWKLIELDLDKLFDLLMKGKDIVFPSGGLGTGLSKMPELCPALFEKMYEKLYVFFGFDNKKGCLLPHIGIDFDKGCVFYVERK